MFLPFYRTILCLTANLSVISSGMGLGYPSISTDQLLKVLTPNQVSWFASVTAITCPIGGLISGYFCEKFGRKGTLIFIDIIAIVSFLLIGFASENFYFLQLMIARVIIGFNIGMSTTPAVMYTAEICSAEVRGRLSMLSSPFFTAFGMVVIYFLGAVVANDHQVSSFYAAAVSFITLLLCLAVPESPVYFVNKNQIEKARKSLARILSLSFSDPQIEIEIEKLQINKSSTSRWQFSEFKHPQLYKPFIMMLIFFTIQQFSGIFTVFIFAAQFSMQVGVVIDPLLSAVIIGLTRMFTIFGFAFLSDKAGRKPLSVTSCAGMFIGMLGLVGCSVFSTELRSSVIFWLPALFMFFFIFTGTFGVLALPFAMLGEVYPQKNRGLAAGMTISYAYTMSFINVKTFSVIFEIFGNTIVFGFYAFVAFIGMFFSIFILVETKGKTLQQIEQYFAGKKKDETRDELNL